MKKIVCFCVLILNFLCFAERDLDKKLFNDSDRITWDFFKSELREYVYTQDHFTKNIYDYSYDTTGPYDELVLTKAGKKNMFLALFPENEDFFLVYGNDSNKALHHGFFSKNSILYISDCKYKATSFLTEDNAVYKAENLGITDLYKPWIEGKTDSGIGEKIEIFSPQKNITALVISNGFVSRKKATYYNNNRIKVLKVINKQNPSEIQELNLPDTARPVEYELKFNSKKIELEIVSIYKGEKYDDTCLNFILSK